MFTFCFDKYLLITKFKCNHVLNLVFFPVSVEVPGERRVQRWAVSIDELVSDPTGLQEFTSFLRKEYSHENIRFWLAVMDLRRSSTKQIPKKLEEIYEYVFIFGSNLKSFSNVFCLYQSF